MAFLSTYDIATPDGGDDPAEADNRMREIKAATQERENVDHYWPLTGTEVSDADAGEHRKVTIRTLSAVEVAALTATKAYIYRLVTDGELYFKDASNNTIQLTVGGILNSVNLTGNQTVAGVKTFSSSPIVPAPTTDLQAATKKYIDDLIAASLLVNRGIAKAWAVIDGTGAISITKGYNTTGVADNGTGVYTITWSIEMADKKYICLVSVGSVGKQAEYRNLTTTTSQVVVFSGGGLPVDDNPISVAIFGDLA